MIIVKKVRDYKAQALVESLLIYCTLFSVILACFIISKIITERQNTALADRLAAFTSTYGKENELDYEKIYEEHSSRSGSKLKIKKSKAKGTGQKGGWGIFTKILGYMSSAQAFEAQTRFSFDKNFTDFLQTVENDAELKEILLIDKDTCANNKALRWSLYGIAMLRAGFSKSTPMSDLGSELFDASKNVTESENFQYE